MLGIYFQYKAYAASIKVIKPLMATAPLESIVYLKKFSCPRMVTDAHVLEGKLTVATKVVHSSLYSYSIYMSVSHCVI